MYNKEFILYMKENINLVKSMVIKSTSTVDALNDFAESQGYAIQYDSPETQPYYLNLAGIYHESNRPIFITSLDTLTEIKFDREVLLKHKNTLREYQKLGDYFDNLYELNPDQELLIRGILNPIPLTKSIPAKNGTILFYDKNYVESNEYDLISELQRYIDMFFDNWYNQGYTLTDELYDAAFFGILASALVTRLLSIRLNKCGTSQVHSFHLWAKLGSNYYLDRYRDYIPRETAMWLYRNIEDIKSNLGKQYTFEKLLLNILTKNIIPASHLIMKNDEEKLDDNYIPEPYIYKQHLNTRDTGILSDNVISTSNLLNRMMPLAEHNSKNISYDIEETNFKSAYSKTSSNDTKVFEAILGHGSNTNSQQLIGDIISYLAYSIFTKIYSRSIIIKNNKGELVKVTIEEAFIIWIYIAHKLNWVEFSHVPVMFFKQVPRIPYGTFKDYRAASHPKWVDDTEIKTAMLLLEPNTMIYDSEEFANRAMNYNHNKHLHFMMYSTRQELNSYVRTREMINMFYINGKYDCKYTGKTYVEFFEQVGLSVDTYDQSYLEILFLSLFSDLTGFDYNKIGSSTNKQKKLIEVVKLLSSYTIQFVTQETTSSGGTNNPNGVMKSLRASDSEINMLSEHDIQMPRLTVKDNAQSNKYTDNIQLVNIKIKEIELSSKYETRVKANLKVKGNGNYLLHMDIPLSTMRILPKKSYYLPNYLPNNKLNGLLQYRFVDALTKIETYLQNNNLSGLKNDVDYN